MHPRRSLSAQYSGLPPCTRCGEVVHCRAWKVWPVLSTFHSLSPRCPALHNTADYRHVQDAAKSSTAALGKFGLSFPLSTLFHLDVQPCIGDHLISTVKSLD